MGTGFAASKSTRRGTHTAFLALGGNQGHVVANFRAALRTLRQTGITVIAYSPLYENAAMVRVGATMQRNYWNGVVRVSTSLTPMALLWLLKHLERCAGRLPGAVWGPRPLDLDLLTYGRRRLQTPSLTVPHPGMAHRLFVLRPLHDIAPQLRIVGQNRTVGQMLRALPSGSGPIIASRKVWVNVSMCCAKALATVNRLSRSFAHRDLCGQLMFCGRTGIEQATSRRRHGGRPYEGTRDA